MKNHSALILILIPLLLFGQGMRNNADAQISASDSLALVDFYNATNGDQWIDNTNWLTLAPASSWFGVSVDVADILELILPANNLTGSIPISFLNLNLLNSIDLSDNCLVNIPILDGLNNLDVLLIRNNFFEFDDVENNFGFGLTVYEYVPQKEYAPEGFYFLDFGDPLSFDFPAGGFDNIYQWFKDGAMLGPAGPMSSLSIPSVDPSDAGDYTLSVTNTGIPGLTLSIAPQHVVVGNCQNEFGQEFFCQQMVIQFEPGTTPFEKTALLNEIGASKIDSCLCNELEIWFIPNNVSLEETVVTSSKKAKVEGTDFNYILDVGPPLTNVDPPSQPPPFVGNLPGPNKVPVAIIDTGFQYDHDSLENRVWVNQDEFPPDGFDDDMNCLVDDYQGYDFVNDTIDVIDLHGHGTHVAGIVALGTPAEIELINLKVFETGKSSLFDVACAVYYAIQKNAKVINASWGYYGEPSEILRDAIQRAGEVCGAIFICSAGNIGNDNDIIPHYPSNFDLDNLISVTALDASENGLASFANFGRKNVDMAAPGENIMSTLPDDLMGLSNGSSMAAAFVSNAAALLYHNKPDATFRSVKQCLFEMIDPIPGGESLLKTGGKLNRSGSISCIMSTPFVSECLPLLEIKAFMHGPYNSGSGLMDDQLRAAGLVPTAQPYNIPPWNYAGTESLSPDQLMLPGSDAIIDWMLIAHIDTSGVDTVFTYQAGVIQADGDVVDIGGNYIRMPTTSSGFIALIHRNHLAVMTDEQISADLQPTVINFTDGSIPTAGVQSQYLDTGVFMMWSADGNSDATSNTFDKNTVWRTQNGQPYIYSTSTGDYNLDGAVNAVDKNGPWRISNGFQSGCIFCY